MNSSKDISVPHDLCYSTVRAGGIVQRIHAINRRCKRVRFHLWIWKVTLEKKMVNHSIISGKFLYRGAWSGCSPRGCKDSDTTEVMYAQASLLK